MKSSDDEIQLKTCPRCKTEIKNCKRIMNEIKKHWLDVQNVKNLVFYNKSHRDLVDIQNEHIQTVKKLEKNELILQGI